MKGILWGCTDTGQGWPAGCVAEFQTSDILPFTLLHLLCVQQQLREVSSEEAGNEMDTDSNRKRKDLCRDNSMTGEVCGRHCLDAVHLPIDCIVEIACATAFLSNCQYLLQAKVQGHLALMTAVCCTASAAVALCVLSAPQSVDNVLACG